jgi:hypothetical protein
MQEPIPLLPLVAWPVQVAIAVLRCWVQTWGSAVPVTEAAAMAPVAVRPNAVTTTRTTVRVTTPAANQRGDGGRRWPR